MTRAYLARGTGEREGQLKSLPVQMMIGPAEITHP